MFYKTLYGKDKNGGYKVWDILVTDHGDYSVIKITHGKEGGVMTEQKTLVKVGKQKRTVFEQGVSEAEGKIKKQLDKGYRELKADLEELPLLAMLAGDYRKIGHRIQYPCYTSVKYDGVRCVAKCTSLGVIKLESRTGQEYDLPHIVTALATVMNPGDVLDGEIYKHGYVLQDIVSAVKRTNTQKELDKANRAYMKVAEDRNCTQEECDALLELAKRLRRFTIFVHNLSSTSSTSQVMKCSAFV